MDEIKKVIKENKEILIFCKKCNKSHARFYYTFVHEPFLWICPNCKTLHSIEWKPEITILN